MSAPNFEKWIAIVAKLNELTQSGKLTWERLDDVTIVNGRHQAHFITKYKDKGFRLIYEWGRKKVTATIDLPMDPTFRLDVVDESGKGIWKIPEVTGTRDLYDSIQYQRAGVKDLLDDLLNE